MSENDREYTDSTLQQLTLEAAEDFELKRRAERLERFSLVGLFRALLRRWSRQAKRPAPRNPSRP